MFDGETRSITTADVICTKQLDGGLVILVADTSTRSVRVQLSQQGRLVVQKAGLRYDNMSGFVTDPREVTATKDDDTFTFSGVFNQSRDGITEHDPTRWSNGFHPLCYADLLTDGGVAQRR